MGQLISPGHSDLPDRPVVPPQIYTETDFLAAVKDGAPPVHQTIPPQKKVDPEAVHANLTGKRSQLWSRDDISHVDKAIFSALEIAAGLTCDMITKGINKIRIDNHEAFLGVYDKRDRDRIYGPNTGLITAGNHLSYCDDPIIIAAFLKKRYLEAAGILWGDDTAYRLWHWMLAAKENYFFHKNPHIRKLFRAFFGYTKTVPIIRKSSVEDPNFNAAEQFAMQRFEGFLRNGDWVNIFPEGTRQYNHGELLPFKNGIGRLAVEAGENAIFVPFGHAGTERISPMGSKMEIRDENGVVRHDFMRGGQEIQVVMGDPVVLRDIVKDVPHTEEGYAYVKEILREEVKRCFGKALILDREAQEMRDW